MINSSLMVILFIGLPVSSQNGETFMYRAAFVRCLRSGRWVFHFSIVPTGIKLIFSKSFTVIVLYLQKSSILSYGVRCVGCCLGFCSGSGIFSCGFGASCFCNCISPLIASINNTTDSTITMVNNKIFIFPSYLWLFIQVWKLMILAPCSRSPLYA